MGSKKKQIILIIILILAIVAAGLFVLHETKSDKAADVDEPSFAPNERPELSILLPKTKYDDVEDFIKKYNAEDNKYFINYQLTGRDYETDPDVINPAIDKAIEECNKLGIKGKATTPFLLAKVKELTGGDSLDSNIQLVFNNAKVAAQTACEMYK